MSEDPVAKLHQYIQLLEKTNDDLLITLKQAVILLKQFTPSVPNPTGWKDMMVKFQEVIKVGERATIQKTIH